ncbi:hypothetical protein QO002_005192 [Pararhizobium capsulatum DSM 1112]|uniref:Uncharacterized protein n=1 Tax=Pararhizobium capsulatum DSM 1112 TaxID=1121113 RepID=A0ABU0BZ77_9HYPH|nr:hypothetical protein [Pararhizobium capsulatum]MDQ0322986.1 hypothetical protein [Pararhizobium capsulatum DSM 1112]
MTCKSDMAILPLDRTLQGGVIFGQYPDEAEQAALGSRLDFYRKECDLVRSYVEALDEDMVVVNSVNGAGDTTHGLAQLADVLLNFETLMLERIGQLELELKIVDGTADFCEEEDCTCAISTI